MASSSHSRSSGLNPFILSEYDARPSSSSSSLGRTAAPTPTPDASSSMRENAVASTSGRSTSSLGKKKASLVDLTPAAFLLRSTSPVKLEYPSASSVEDVKGKARESTPLSHKELLSKVINSKNNVLTTREGTSAPIDVVVSCSSGHQVANYGPGRKKVDNYFSDRNRKLKEQVAPKTNDLFRGVTVWIDGLVSSAGMSNLELTRLISTNGGSISNAPGFRVTHILSSTPLSGSKMQKLMSKARGWKPAVVKPEWVVESVALGKRASVGKFSILQASESQKTLFSTTRPLTTSNASSNQRPNVARSIKVEPNPSTFASSKIKTTAEGAILVLDSDDE